MKVLVRSTVDQPTAEDVLTATLTHLCPISEPMGAKDPERLTEGRVVDLPPSAITAVLRRLAEVDWGKAPAQREAAEGLRSLKRLAKQIASAEEGDIVKVEPVRAGLKIIVPRPEAPDLEVGDAVAFNQNCSPKYMLNVRAEVVETHGAKVTVELDEGDRTRLVKSGHERFGLRMKAPVAILDKVGA